MVVKWFVKRAASCYLEQLVAGEEVGGGLQDGRHGLGQLLVHRPDTRRRIGLWLEHKLQGGEAKAIRNQSSSPTLLSLVQDDEKKAQP